MINLTQLLVLDPEKRISLENVERHPWIIKHCKGSARAYERTSGDKFRKSSE
jgi:aurora kinase